jgi:hypothetical protein
MLFLRIHYFQAQQAETDNGPTRGDGRFEEHLSKSHEAPFMLLGCIVNEDELPLCSKVFFFCSIRNVAIQLECTTVP